jgi:hypothetical protein
MTLDDRLKRAVDSLGDKLREEIAKELSSLNVAPPGNGASMGRLAEAMSAMDHATSLSDILHTLGTAASVESARAGVFLLYGGSIRSFRLFGFPPQFDSAPIDLPLSTESVIADAVRQRTTATSVAGPFEEQRSGSNAVAVPLVLAGAAIGALYVEGADVPTAEILTRFASRALEAQTAMMTARAFSSGQVA